jgi:hypothetical protein
MQDYFRMVEEFVKEEYGFDIKIQVPYLDVTAVEPKVAPKEEKIL